MSELQDRMSGCQDNMSGWQDNMSGVQDNISGWQYSWWVKDWLELTEGLNNESEFRKNILPVLNRGQCTFCKFRRGSE
jgi:hypothetical protein